MAFPMPHTSSTAILSLPCMTTQCFQSLLTDADEDESTEGPRLFTSQDR
ncbi:hypothetical protein A2U01_0100649, partial [Trifolium medium]|nr:hypothetical protein [Trifolium medium]